MSKVYVIVKIRVVVRVEEGETPEEILNDADFEPRHPDPTRIEYLEVKDYEVEDSK